MAHFIRYLIFCCSLTLGTAALAQVPKGPDGQRTFSVLSLASSPADVEGLFLLQNKQPVELKFRGGARSQPIPIASPARPLMIARKGKAYTAEQPAYDTVAQVSWPDANAKTILLLVSVNPTNKAVSVLAINDDVEAFPVQTIKAVNATRIPLMIKANTFTGEIAPGGVSQPIAYPSLDKSKPNSVALYPFAIALKQPNAEPTLLSSGKQEAAAGSRSLIVILPPTEPNSTKVRTKVIIDRPAVNVPPLGRQ